MTSQQQEQISALLDGELSAEQTHSTIRRLEQEPELLACWSRYARIGEAMRGEHMLPGAESIADKVAAALVDEPTVLAPPPPRKSNWRGPLAGAAIAATVAAMAIVYLPPMLGTPEQPSMQVATVQPMPAAGAVQTVASTGSEAGQVRWNARTPEMEARLNRLLLDHSEYAGQANMAGVLPYASFVSYNGNR